MNPSVLWVIWHALGTEDEKNMRVPQLHTSDGTVQTDCISSLLKLKRGWRTQAHPHAIPGFALLSVRQSGFFFSSFCLNAMPTQGTGLPPSPGLHRRSGINTGRKSSLSLLWQANCSPWLKVSLQKMIHPPLLQFTLWRPTLTLPFTTRSLASQLNHLRSFNISHLVVG